MKLTGYLLTSMDGTFFFRTYDGEGDFVDYDIRTADLQITIDDKHAQVYTRADGSHYIDHTPKVLGRKEGDPD